ncbi:MAG: TMEM165/GDT1 family protein [Elusimicrobiota bacterium]|jgi:putative Ca2+/H+ antiporter (TMEM165/GDT1 family)|nr:TMEM165/GDT1 family protein [Elusimicrobiota bacterium]
MEIFLSSFFIIFIAEMGDKTQLLALSFALRFKTITVILAIMAATLLNHFAAVLLGHWTSGFLPVKLISFISGILFIFFGLWTLKGDSLDEKDGKNEIILNPFFTVAIAFFIAEMGDKTQLATLTLSIKHPSFISVLAGSSFGMIIADALGIAVGIILGKSLPEKTIKYSAAFLFIVFGILQVFAIA